MLCVQDNAERHKEAVAALEHSIKSYLLATCDAFGLDEVENSIATQVTPRVVSPLINHFTDKNLIELDLHVAAWILVHKSTARHAEQLHRASNEARMEVEQSNAALLSRC
jgi:hypothetical protein